jgi:ABC-2 type transport system ATP-binding protein
VRSARNSRQFGVAIDLDGVLISCENQIGILEKNMPENAIVTNDLTYQYGELTAVDHIGFEVAEQEIFDFLGPNGAGKSTTVNLLTGQLKPKDGQATVLGMDVADNPNKVQEKIGVCFEITNLYEQLSA